MLGVLPPSENNNYRKSAASTLFSFLKIKYIPPNIPTPNNPRKTGPVLCIFKAMTNLKLVLLGKTWQLLHKNIHFLSTEDAIKSRIHIPKLDNFS